MNNSTSATDHLRHELMVCGFSNLIFNSLAAWLLLRNGPVLRWNGESSFVVDIIATGFLLPFIVALIVVPLQRRKLKQGALQPINLGSASFLQSLANRFPSGTFKCAILFGLIGMLVIAPLTLLIFYLVGIIAVSPLQYAVLKGIWAGLMAATLVVPMVLIALRNPEPTFKQLIRGV